VALQVVATIPYQGNKMLVLIGTMADSVNVGPMLKAVLQRGRV
jgi:hypothetical protein